MRINFDLGFVTIKKQLGKAMDGFNQNGWSAAWVRLEFR
jgi:hypothetical protein